MDYPRPWLNDAEKKLIAGLRSGDFKQVVGRLKRTDGYCCLGVACEISGLGKWGAKYSESGGFSFRPNDGSIAVLTDLPEPVMKWLGWSTRPGKTHIIRRGVNYGFYLVELNDGGLTFDQIADVIEAGLMDKEGESDE